MGVSGDSLAAASLLAGAPTWFSVIGGLLPEAALTVTRAARTGDTAQAIEASDRLSGLWELFETYGSLRVVATAAAQLGLTQQVNLPRPLRRLDGAGRERLEADPIAGATPQQLSQIARKPEARSASPGSSGRPLG